jgi:iron transport multicopper oxidase
MHLIGGMASTMIEAPRKLQNQQVIPSSGAGLCSNNNQCSYGNCACKAGKISAKDADQQCNSIFNYKGMNWGAQVSK